MAKNKHKPTRRSFLKYGIVAAALGAAALVGAQFIERKENRSKGLVALTFENSVLHPNIRQAYLNRLFENRYQEQDEAWLSISEFVYDPKLDIIKRHGAIQPCVYERGETVIITPDGSNLRGKTVPIYLTQFAFTLGYVQSEDELKSSIDHESAHALMVHRSQFHISLPTEALVQLPLLPSEIQGKLIESLAFEKQIVTYAGFRKRTVSSEFDRDKYESYRSLNEDLERYAAANPEHGKIILPILKALRVQPKKE